MHMITIIITVVALLSISFTVFIKVEECESTLGLNEHNRFVVFDVWEDSLAHLFSVNVLQYLGHPHFSPLERDISSVKTQATSSYRCIHYVSESKVWRLLPILSLQCSVLSSEGI